MTQIRGFDETLYSSPLARKRSRKGSGFALLVALTLIFVCSPAVSETTTPELPDSDSDSDSISKRHSTEVDKSERSGIPADELHIDWQSFGPQSFQDEVLTEAEHAFRTLVDIAEGLQRDIPLTVDLPQLSGFYVELNLELAP